MMTTFIPTEIPEVILFTPRVFKDDRGFFMETYQKDEFSRAEIAYDFVQDNHSSSIKFTLRGLHYQVSHTQGKLVRVVIGKIFDVAVDLRQSSPYFGKWVSAYLSADNLQQLWIPPGFGHGFLVLSDRADVVYKATDYYDPQGERTILWNDPNLSIKWPLPEGIEPIISNKDASGKLITEAEVFL
jgi:dTDP-4-dehydrorhamnose 3,5-epimerase